MEQGMQPVEMLTVCGADGTLQPVRFRYETPEHETRTMHILEIVCTKPLSHVGIPAILYVCKVRQGEQEHLLELKYMVQAHRWVLFRVIY